MFMSLKWIGFVSYAMETSFKGLKGLQRTNDIKIAYMSLVIILVFSNGAKM